MAIYSTRQAAEIKVISERRIRRMITDGKLKAEKVGRDWIIEQAELDKIITYGKAGRPPKTKRSK